MIRILAMALLVAVVAIAEVGCFSVRKAPSSLPPPECRAPRPPDDKPQLSSLLPSSEHRQQATVVASMYGEGDNLAGNKTASGERFNPRDLTAAHRTFPFGTRLKVTNAINGKSVTVRVNDRGPFIEGRSIDLSSAAAKRIGMERCGLADVQIEVISTPTKKSS